MGLRTRKRTITHDGMHSGNGSCGEKNVTKRPKTTVESLPRDLLVDVFTRVASSSFIDVFNAKLCCKDFLEVGEDDYICQCISHDTFPIIHWFQPRDEVLSFQANCVKKGNPEALFRQGMVDYFNIVKGESGLKYLKTTAEKVDSGLRYLKTAAEKGHIVAKYVYGMIMLSHGDEKALNLLTSLKCSRRQGYSKVVECRNRVKSILWTMWIRDSISIKGVNFKCQERDHIVCVRRMGFDEISAFPSCDSCMWSRELVEFGKILNRDA